MTDFYVYLSFFVIKQVKKHRNIHIKFFTFLQGGGVSTFCSIIHFIFFHFIGGEGGCKGRKCHFHFLLCLFFLIASLRGCKLISYIEIRGRGSRETYLKHIFTQYRGTGKILDNGEVLKLQLSYQKYVKIVAKILKKSYKNVNKY